MRKEKTEAPVYDDTAMSPGVPAVQRSHRHVPLIVWVSEAGHYFALPECREGSLYVCLVLLCVSS